jgi:hypothetical protein
VNNKNNVNGVSLLHLSHLITLMDWLCSQGSPNSKNMNFMFDWTIYTRFVLNRPCKREYLEIVILVNVCSTWSFVELKTRFETRIKYDVNGVSLFHFSHLITLTAYLCSQWSPNVQIKYFMYDWSIYRLFLLNRGWKPVSLQIMIYVYFCLIWGLVEVNSRFGT